MNKWRLMLPLLVCLLVSGCWNRVELNDIAVISATGVDWKDGKWVVSYQVVIPQAISSQSATSNSAAVNVFSTKGESFRSAVSKASQETCAASLLLAYTNRHHRPGGCPQRAGSAA